MGKIKDLYENILKDIFFSEDLLSIGTSEIGKLSDYFEKWVKDNTRENRDTYDNELNAFLGYMRAEQKTRIKNKIAQRIERNLPDILKFLKD